MLLRWLHYLVTLNTDVHCLISSIPRHFLKLLSKPHDHHHFTLIIPPHIPIKADVSETEKHICDKMTFESSVSQPMTFHFAVPIYHKPLPFWMLISLFDACQVNVCSSSVSCASHFLHEHDCKIVFKLLFVAFIFFYFWDHPSAWREITTSIWSLNGVWFLN